MLNLFDSQYINKYGFTNISRNDMLSNRYLVFRRIEVKRNFTVPKRKAIPEHLPTMVYIKSVGHTEFTDGADSSPVQFSSEITNRRHFSMGRFPHPCKYDPVLTTVCSHGGASLSKQTGINTSEYRLRNRLHSNRTSTTINDKKRASTRINNTIFLRVISRAPFSQPTATEYLVILLREKGVDFVSPKVAQKSQIQFFEMPKAKETDV